MKVLHTVLNVTGIIARYACAGDFLHRGMVLIQYGAIERKVKVVKNRWCHPAELEAVRSSPRRVVEVPPEIQAEVNPRAAEKSIRAKRAFEEALEFVELDSEVEEVVADAPELAAHEVGRKLPQKTVNAARSGTGTKWRIGGSHVTKQTSVPIQERLKVFPNESLIEAASPNGKVLFCRCCPKTLQNILGTIKTHVSSDTHKEKLARWLKRQQGDNTVAQYLHEYFQAHPSEKDSSVADEVQLYRWRVVEACMHAGIPLAKTDEIRVLLERRGIPLTNSSHLGVFIPKIEAFELKRIQHELSDQPLCIIFDGTNRFGDCTAVLMRWCSESFESIEQRLVALRTVKKHLNGDNLGPFLIDIIGQLKVRSASIVCTARDSCATNGKALASIQPILSNSESIMCISHTLSHCAEHVDLPLLKEFMTSWLGLVQHHPAAKSAWRECVGGSMKGFSNTRWLSREEVVNELAENYAQLPDYVEMLVRDEIGDALPKKMQEILRTRGDDLQVCVLHARLSAFAHDRTQS